MTPATRQFDPITLEIMWSRLINISEECWVTIWRTAFSTIMGEAMDFGVEVLDAKGQTLAHAPRSMPVFNIALPTFVNNLLQQFPAEALEPGDVLIGNDPWLLAGHLFDIGIVTPVFRNGKVVGLIGSVGHASDIGGVYDSGSVRELYDEGLLIPACKLYKAGRPNEDLMNVIRHNVRQPEMVLGDIEAQVAANDVGARRLLAFMDEYCLDDLEDLAATLQGRSEEAMRKAIAALPDGEYTHEVYADGLGDPLLIPVKITVRDSDLLVDFTGAPPQVDRGGINCTLNYTMAHAIYAIKCLLTPGIPSNAGCYRPITITAPEGSILNCLKPASVNLRTRVGWRVAPAIFGALAPAIADKVQGFTGLPLGMGAYGVDDDGRHFHDHLFQGGGQGGSSYGDGQNTLLFPTSAANVSIEMFENRTPLLVDCKEFISDSGGAGKQRGGLGQRVALRRRPGSEAKAWVSIFPEGMLAETPGHFGGKSGRLTKVYVDRNGAREELLGGGMIELTGEDQVVTIELAGGSGYGDPRERDRKLVERDLAEGYISADGAKAYGTDE